MEAASVPAAAGPVRVIRRQITLLPLIGIMFFTVSGGAYGLEDAVGSSGPGMALLLILVTPLIWAIPAALMVAELSTALPVQGGYYYWAKVGLGRFWAFQEGWWSWLTTFVDMAIYPVLFADYLAVFFPEVGESAVIHWLVTLAVIWPMAYLNIRGAKGIGDTSNAFGVFVIAPFVVVSVVGIAKLIIDGIDPLTPFTPPGEGFAGAFGVGLFVVMWNYLGWDGLSTVTGEMQNPRKIYPKALAISVPLITACYFLPVLGGLAASPDWQGWTAGYFPEVAGMLAGDWLKWWLSIGALVSALGLFMALLLSVSRVPFAMAEDRWLPKGLTRMHRKHDTPWVAIVVCGVIYSVFTLSAFASLVVVDVFIYSLALMLEFAALIALRIKYPAMDRPFKIPGGWPVIALITFLPIAIVAFAVYSTVAEEGISALYLSLGAAVTGPLLYPVAKLLINKGDPGRDVAGELGLAEKPDSPPPAAASGSAD